MRRRYWIGKPVIGIRGIWCAITAIGILMAVFCGYCRLEDMVRIYGEKRCKNLLESTVMEVISQIPGHEGMSRITTVDSKIVLQLDSACAQKIQQETGRKLTEALNSMGAQSYKVPIGTVLENVFLIGFGPEVTLRFVPVGAAEVWVESAVEEAGINQVLYQVFLNIESDVSILLPGGVSSMEYKKRVLLEEALVTGPVPYVHAG